jgi:putative endonuclease
MCWCVYILLCNDKTLYTGVTNNLEKRLRDHEAGSGAKYTRGRGPLKLLYRENHETRSQAQKREFHIKTLSRQDKLDLIAQIHLG